LNAANIFPISPQVEAKIADVGPDMIADLEELVAHAATEVFGTMLRAPLDSGFANGATEIAASVGLIGRPGGVMPYVPAIPLALRRSYFSVAATSATEGHSIRFDSGQGGIYIQLFLKPNDTGRN
jgi:hypothetical protein